MNDNKNADTQIIKLTDEEAAKQCALVRNPGQRLHKLARWLVQQHGSDSERHGIGFGLFPQWAIERAKALLDKLSSPWDL